MSSNFDLDLSFDDEAASGDLSGVSAAEIAREVELLPVALRDVARAILVEERTMSDVSQALSIRQSELVTRLHRAKQHIAINLGL